MPNWKKVIVSGSDALVRQITSSMLAVGVGTEPRLAIKEDGSIVTLSAVDSQPDNDWFVNEAGGYISSSLDVQITGSLDVQGDITSSDLLLSGDGSPEIISDVDLVISASQGLEISASFISMNGPLSADLELNNNLAGASPVYNALHYDSESNEIFYSDTMGYYSIIYAGSDFNSPSVQGKRAASALLLSTGSNNLSIITGSQDSVLGIPLQDFVDEISFDLSDTISITNLTASANISASGFLFASTSDGSGLNFMNALIDTESGQFYFSPGGVADADWVLNTGGTENTLTNYTDSDYEGAAVLIGSASNNPFNGVPTTTGRRNLVVAGKGLSNLTEGLGTTNRLPGILIHDSLSSIGGNSVNLDFSVNQGGTLGRLAYLEETSNKGSFKFITQNGSSNYSNVFSIKEDGEISASGLLFTSLSAPAAHDGSIVAVVYDTASGQYFYTGSYGVGSGGDGSGTSITTVDIDNTSLGDQSFTNGSGFDTLNFVAGPNITLSASAASQTANIIISSSGGTATPAGSNTDIQFNDGGNFGADTGEFTYDKTNNILSIGAADKQIQFAQGVGSGNQNNLLQLSGHSSRVIAFCERIDPALQEGGDDFYATFEKGSKYFALYPKRSTPLEPTARLEVIDEPTNSGQPVARIRNDKTQSKQLLSLEHAFTPNQYQTVSYISFNHTATAAGSTTAGMIGISAQYGGQLIFTGLPVNQSDKKLKKNITDTKKSIDDIMSIKVKDFRWKKQDKATEKITGFIAQELQETHPELVSDVDGTLHITSTNIIPLLVKAVQDQQQQINELKELLKTK